MNSLEIFQKVKEKKYFEALLLAEKNYTENPKNINSLVDYITILINLNKLQKAEEIIVSSRFKPETNPNLYFLLISLYSAMGEVDKLKTLEKKNKLEGIFTGYANISSLHKSQQEKERNYYNNQFTEILRIFIKKFPEHEKIFKKAIIQVTNDFVKEAQKLIKDYSKTIDDSVLGYFLIAEIAMMEGKYDLAKRRYEKILKTFKDKYIIFNRLGDIELSKNNPDQANIYYKKAIELNPNDLDTTADLIRTHISRKDFHKAKKEYLKACRIFPKEKLKWLKHEIENVEEEAGKKYVNGLAWFEGGGNVVKIEIDSEDGEGHLMLTGNMGYHLIDALHLSHRVSNKLCERLTKSKKRKDIYVNIPNALVYIDGPSIGLAATIGMLSEIIDKEISEDYAFTGEITLHGNIIPVGGLNWKLTAAYLNNIKTVFIPKQNFRDLRTIPENVKSHIEIKLVSNIQEVAKYLWD